MQQDAYKPFDPIDCLELAKELSESQDECKLRAAVGRAYYAIFIVARDRMHITDEINVHSTVSYEISRRQRNLIKEWFDDMKDLRRVADYEMTPVDPAQRNWRDNWKTQEALATRLLPKMQALPAHRQR